MPIPMPSLFPPPAVGTLPQQPSRPIVVGRPGDFWNWSPDEWGDWVRGIFESRPSPAVEKKCDELLRAEYERCETLARKAAAEAGRERGARELMSCNENARMRNAECMANKGTPKSPPYTDWYDDDDPPYPDDFENPYPKKS